ncbi:MAG: hypothetical protein RBU37_00530 [Myxococcota bacterium]|nr:hypothetical protein [Myxococcota bacterium]
MTSTRTTLLVDYPAGHSMDSGWFILDEDGRLGYFDTGEAGAIPRQIPFATGEIVRAVEDDVNELWFVFILPWIIRHRSPPPPSALDDICLLYDSVENAHRALDEGASTISQNPFLVFIECPRAGWPESFGAAQNDEQREQYSRFERLRALPGFLGYAPRWFSDACEHAGLLPLAFFKHGCWDIPGHYVRQSAACTDFSLPPEIADKLWRIKSSFELAEIQLADSFSNEECQTYVGEQDLRTGEIL